MDKEKGRVSIKSFLNVVLGGNRVSRMGRKCNWRVDFSMFLLSYCLRLSLNWV